MFTSGFVHAPLSRVLTYGLVAASLLVSVTDSKHFFYIQVEPHFWPLGQLWRAAIFQLCYLNASEVLVATMTLYHLRVVERLWGSRKYAVGGRSDAVATAPCVRAPADVSVVLSGDQCCFNGFPCTGAPCRLPATVILGSIQLPARGSDAHHLCPACAIPRHGPAHLQVPRGDVRARRARGFHGCHVVRQGLCLLTGGAACPVSDAGLGAGGRAGLDRRFGVAE